MLYYFQPGPSGAAVPTGTAGVIFDIINGREGVVLRWKDLEIWKGFGLAESARWGHRADSLGVTAADGVGATSQTGDREVVGG